MRPYILTGFREICNRLCLARPRKDHNKIALLEGRRDCLADNVRRETKVHKAHGKPFCDEPRPSCTHHINSPCMQDLGNKPVYIRIRE